MHSGSFLHANLIRVELIARKNMMKLPSLSNLHACKNIAFIGPGGIDKTSLAKDYERQRCLAEFKLYYLKTSELHDRLQKQPVQATHHARLLH